MIALLRNLLHLRKALTTDDTPRQLALGCAFGMLLGLLPKDNLLFVFLSTLVFACRVNLSAVVMATLAFSVVASFLDPIVHPLGWRILTAEPLVPHWERLHRLPLAPWTAFNNTVVMGSLALGLMLFYPVYHLSVVAVTRLRSRAVQAEDTVEPDVEAESHSQQPANQVAA